MANACVDGHILPAEEATISVLDEGLIRGDGAFEVVRLYGARPFALEDHLKRLQGSASNLRLEIDLGAIRADLDALLETAEPEDADGAIRLIVTRGGRRISFFEALEPFAESLTLATVTFAPTRILDGIKSLSYAGNRLATRVAREQGADEALLVTPHGRVLEAPTSAFFWVRDGALLTPPLSDHILDSITRRRLMAALEAEERETALDDLQGAEEAFLASTTREVQAVRAIDGRALPEAPGARTRDARDAFARVVAAELGPSRMAVGLPLVRWRRPPTSLRIERGTLALAIAALTSAGAVAVLELGRVWRRGAAPLPPQADNLFEAAATVARETSEVTVASYQEATEHEAALLNLLGSFVLTFAFARVATWTIRRRGRLGPFRNLSLGHRHIHHFVPGVVLALVSGAASIISSDESLDQWLAIPFGAGAGLVLDESALLLQFDDVYWTEEGVLSLQITLTTIGILATGAIAARVVRRGEAKVLAPTPS